MSSTLLADGGRVEPLAPGQVVGGRYRIEEKVGAGGMGVVYRARDLKLERAVAFKVLNHLAAQSPGMPERFLREARAAARIKHPGVVDVYDVVECGPLICIAMEWLRGQDLSRRVKRAPLGVLDALDLGIELAEAVAAAHAEGIIHRDLKPENIFLAEEGARVVLKVLDFGIAKLANAAPGTPRLTETDQIFGTRLYMSPEQLRGLPVDERTDVFAMGAVLYEVLAGRPAFAALEPPGSTAQPQGKAAARRQSQEPLGLQRPDVPGSFIQLIDDAMAPDVDRRVPSARALADCLRSIRRALPTSEAATVSSTPLAPTTASARRRSPWRWLLLPALAAAVVMIILVRSKLRLQRPATIATSTAVEPSATGEPTVSPPTAPASQPVRFESQPPGAEIRLETDGQPGSRCRAPCTLTLAAKTHQLVAELRGHRRLVQSLSPPLPEVVRLSLERAARAGAGVAGRRSPPTGSAQPEGLPAPPPIEERP